MSTQSRTVRLLQNVLYPTYQLYAAMGSKQTAPRDGLRLAALTTMEWLRQRIQDDIPAELCQPGPDEYRTADDSNLPSLHLNRGYVLDIVSLPEKGVWSLQITEPDLGSDPGKKEQRRAAVPGRVIETNVAFRSYGKELECGFQTVVSDPEGTSPQAEVYRLAVVRRLMENPAFGLTQILPVNGSVTEVKTAAQIRKLTTLISTPENQLPAVVFTYYQKQCTVLPVKNTAPKVLNTLPQQMPDIFSARQEMHYEERFNLLTAARQPEEELTLPCDVPAFAEKMKGFCRTYLLDAGLLPGLAKAVGVCLNPGDVTLLEPLRFGGRTQVFPYRPSKQEKMVDDLTGALYTYPRGRSYSFGHIEFLSAARENLLHATAQAVSETEAVSDQWAEKFTRLQDTCKAEIAKKDAEAAQLRRQVDRLKLYQAQLEKEKEQLAQQLYQEQENCKLQLQARDGEVAYLERKLTRPLKHTDVVEWVRQQFADRLIMHKRTETLLAKKTAWGVDLGLLCDALDFLATDYWDYRFSRLPKDEMNRRCSAKYGRPFDVSKLGDYTIEFTPSEYKVKYKMTGTEKAREYALNWHLKVGNDPENLLRIYFFPDDKAQKLVIGSLPEHLRAVQIQ